MGEGRGGAWAMGGRRRGGAGLWVGGEGKGRGLVCGWAGEGLQKDLCMRLQKVRVEEMRMTMVTDNGG